MKNKLKKILFLVMIIITISLKNLAYANTEKLQIVETQEFATATWSAEYDGDGIYDDGWGYDYYEEDDYYYEESSSLGAGIGLIIFIVFFSIIVYILLKNNKNKKSSKDYSGMSNGYSNSEPNIAEELIADNIRSIDPNFSREDFLAYAKDVFVKLQYAWSDRNLEVLRCFETPQLFEHHKGQMQRYIDNRQINKLEKVSIIWAKLFKFDQDGSKEVLSVLMNTKMIDYIFDESKGEIVKGSNTDFELNTYKLTFIRNSGVKTVPGTTSVNTTNCPNCGAPVQITSKGKCSYCGTLISAGNFNWVLSNMEIYEEPIDNWNPFNDGNIGGFGSSFIAGAITGGIIREVLRPRPPFGGFGSMPPRRGPRPPRR